MVKEVCHQEEMCSQQGIIFWTRTKRMIWQALTLAAALSGVTSTNLNFKAWQSSNAYPVPSDFPELKEETVTKRPNTAIAFTGGGSRSFLASIGYLAGLTELGKNNSFQLFLILTFRRLDAQYSLHLWDQWWKLGNLNLHLFSTCMFFLLPPPPCLLTIHPSSSLLLSSGC
jgi:hypothetical protein